MPNNESEDYFQLIPKRIYTSQLKSGLFELSLHVLLGVFDGGSDTRVVWEISSKDGSFRLSSSFPAPEIQDASVQILPITATLPESWNGGVLHIQVLSDQLSAELKISLEPFTQGVEFVLPLSGQALTVGGHRLGEMHRSALQIPSQQFGWDFVGLGATDLSIAYLDASRPLLAADFPGYGSAVIAPAEGRISDCHDGAEDLQDIGRLPEILSNYRENLIRALGNYVIIEHERGLWSVLAHLKQGSLTVEPGQIVSLGEKVGALGNSGFTSGPHLHFHVMDGPEITNSSPLPIKLSLEEGVFAPESGDIIANAEILA